MSDPTPPPGDLSGFQPSSPPPPPQQAPLSARVPEKVARGVFTTGQVVLDGPKEFVVDFFQHLTRPHQVVARVVMTPQTISELIAALKQNIENFSKAFGPPPVLPLPQPGRTNLQELYDNFKVPDDMLSGVYANGVLIGHSPSEFFFDFLTGFFPAAAVSARVFLPAGQAPRFLTALENGMKQYKTKMSGQQPPQQPPRDV
ncbi:DUF3467 domain-containing protein [Humisphaera borealis]|uniref:DUF3467 domain-containing protein n=1 Tax=Humisphaera borealis TaxID=2807512 RepID=A0A7M2WVV1_9BACT|nr:DUF3467 domain-containing protein [Humisphaera borealis]QOV88610.1 DUF3467 domain-containing protein [Humisphaera borealis]